MNGRDRLREWMKANDHNQQWLADQIRTHQTNVSAWLRGRAVPLDMAIRLRAVTGIEVEAWVTDQAEAVSDSGTLPAAGSKTRAAG